MAVVVNRPKDLSREQLREVRLLLDEHGYSEARLQTAWRNRSNQDIAASIIGYIRQAALGEALLPFEQRVAQAMQRIFGLTQLDPVQRKWLDRLAKQLHHEVVIDQQFVNRAFAKPTAVPSGWTPCSAATGCRCSKRWPTTCGPMPRKSALSCRIRNTTRIQCV